PTVHVGFIGEDSRLYFVLLDVQYGNAGTGISPEFHPALWISHPYDVQQWEYRSVRVESHPDGKHTCSYPEAVSVAPGQYVSHGIVCMFEKQNLDGLWTSRAAIQLVAGSSSREYPFVFALSPKYQP
ncbi:MAG: hypothetical protein ACM3VT_09615, partial [Solirubrobacterales bacterium]